MNQLTPIASFGGDIVRIEAGPGGAFGNYVYAISRGAGENAGAANRPGVIYRVDPATGKTSVFFDLNTVVTQLTPPSADASNSVSTASGLVNWYDLAFDPEGYFDGKPSLFVASVDRSDPNKNVVYRDRARRLIHGGVRPVHLGTNGAEVQRQPDRCPRPAGPGPVVPARIVHGVGRLDVDVRTRSTRCSSTRTPMPGHADHLDDASQRRDSIGAWGWVRRSA